MKHIAFIDAGKEGVHVYQLNSGAVQLYTVDEKGRFASGVTVPQDAVTELVKVLVGLQPEGLRLTAPAAWPDQAADDPPDLQQIREKVAKALGMEPPIEPAPYVLGLDLARNPGNRGIDVKVDGVTRRREASPIDPKPDQAADDIDNHYKKFEG